MTEKVKKQTVRKNLQIIADIAIIIFFVALIAPPILNKIVESKVKEQLTQLVPLAKISFSSIHANFFASSLSINNLSIKLQPVAKDSIHYHAINFSKVDFTGISFLRAVLNKKLLIDKLTLEKGDIQFEQYLLDKKDSLQYDLSTNMSFKNISVKYFEVNEASVWIHSNQNKLLLKGIIDVYNIEINNSKQSELAKNFHFNAVQCNITDVNYFLPSLRQTFQIKQLSLDSRKGVLIIDSLKVIPDELNDSANHIRALISNIQVSKLDIMQLENKKLIAGTIHIKKCDANIFDLKSVQKNSEESAFNLNQIPNEIKIDSFIVEHSSVDLQNINEKNLATNQKDFELTTLKKLSIHVFVITGTTVKLHQKNINQFKIEKIELTDFNKSLDSDFNCGSFRCNLLDMNFSMPYRNVHVTNLIADSKMALLKINDLKITTTYQKYEFGEKLGHQADYIYATVPGIEILKLDWQQLLHKKLVAGEININNSNIYFFRDRRLPRVLKEQPMPNDYLKEIPIEVRVNSLKINNANVISEEFPKVGSETGYLEISKVNITMSPMLNRPYKTDPGYSDTYVEGSIMNAGLIKATIHAHLRQNIYFIKGTIENLNLPKLNPSAENLGRFHIESGILNFLDFHFTATEEKATGEIIGEYHDLLIDRLQKKGKKVARTPTFILKHLIIPKNKDKSLPVSRRNGKIDFKRDPTRFVTFYFLKTLLDGIRASFDLGFVLPK